MSLKKYKKKRLKNLQIMSIFKQTVFNSDLENKKRARIYTTKGF